MTKGRLEAFSDGVIAILITIMVLEFHAPAGRDLSALAAILPSLSSYALSFLLGIYWNNHHHMLHAAKRIDGAVLWANLGLLFSLSLVPFATAWVGSSNFGPQPVAFYGAMQTACAIAYSFLSKFLVRVNGKGSAFAKALGDDKKGKLSLVLSVLTIPVALVSPYLAIAIFLSIYAMWLVPDRRFEGVREE